ncbi:MAG TPA: GlsB/YeaQ/YmgE family stress response membrane protein [Oscillatoriaceae cyanobacterium]
MSLLAWIIVGLIAGLLATWVVPGTGTNWLVDIVVGMIGAIIGGWIFRAFGAAGATGLNVWSVIVAFIGAVILLWIVKAVQTRRG